MTRTRRSRLGAPHGSETIAVHLAEQVSTHDVQCEPLALTNSYRFDSPLDAELKFAGLRPGHVYTRISNPNVAALEQRVAAMEGGEQGVAFATGLAAIDAVFSARLRSGDHLLCSRDVFGTTAHLIKSSYAERGIEVDFVDIGADDAPSRWAALMKPNTRLLFLETPSNPNLYIADLPRFAALCDGRDCLLVVDNTIATPAIQKPLSQGAHVVVHSAGKYLDGQGRVMGGLVICDAKLALDLRAMLRNRGSSISPFNAWVLTKSIETLHIRMRAHSQKAAYLVKRLNQHAMVRLVNYPGGKDYRYTDLANQQHQPEIGHGGLFSFQVAGDRAFAWRVMENLRLIAISTNIGDTKSLVTHPASTTHARLSAEEKRLAAVSESLLRISVGLEDEHDLIADLFEALDLARAARQADNRPALPRSRAARVCP